ncbi:MAG: hypothetical protein A3K77_08530 [Euryarchaeota archaeon RBG_13_31_8]|nr:MAG: hypothetical protein A3K77_08530 [Euryarchaeota archaeon RBG_13_31_8]
MYNDKNINKTYGEQLTYVESICKIPEKQLKPVGKFEVLYTRNTIDISMNINKEVFLKYQREVNLGKTSHTKELDRQFLSKFSVYVKKPFTEVTKDDIINFLNDLENGVVTTRYDKPYKKYTIELFKSQIKKFYKWLYHWEDGMALPEQIKGIKLNINKAYVRKTKADMLDEGEIQQLINSCGNARDKAIIAVMYDGCFRIGEFAPMKIGDIIRDDDGKIGIVINGKTGQGVGWLNKSVAYLENYLKTHPDSKNSNAPLWITQMNKPFSYSGLQHLIVSIAEQAKIGKHISCHTLRHSRIRYLKNKGMPEAHLRKVARWSKDSIMPSVYGAIDGDDAKRELFAIDKPQKVYTKKELDKEVDKQVAELKEQVELLMGYYKELTNTQ